MWRRRNCCGLPARRRERGPLYVHPLASVHPRSKLAVRSPVRPSGSEWLGRSAFGRPFLRFCGGGERPTARGGGTSHRLGPVVIFGGRLNAQGPRGACGRLLRAT